MADRPLRPATHRRLGRPLPYQLANGTRAHLSPVAFNEEATFAGKTEIPPEYAVLAHLSVRYPPEKGRLPTRYSPVRHFTPPASRGFSYDLHVLRMPPALILSQDQTLQLNLEFSHTRAHYLVFKEQILLIGIINIFLPLSSAFSVKLPRPPQWQKCF